MLAKQLFFIFFATLTAAEAVVLETLQGQKDRHHHHHSSEERRGRSFLDFLSPTTQRPFGIIPDFNRRGEFDGRDNGRYQDGYNPYPSQQNQYPGQYPQGNYPGQNPYGPYGTTAGFPFNLLPTQPPPPPPAPFPFNLIPTTPPPMPFPLNLLFPTTPRPFPFNLLG